MSQNFAMYPLCIDTIEKISSNVHNFDGTCGEITCVKGTTQDTSFWDGWMKNLWFLLYFRTESDKLHN